MTLKLALIGLTALVSSSSLASTVLTIESENFRPETIVTGEWVGEPMVGDVRGYGVSGLDTVVAFFEEHDLNQVVASVINFQTDESIHAVHLHGIGSGHSLSELHGYTVVYGDEHIGVYRMVTYTRDAQRFVLDERFTSSARGALDCASAAKLAILHGPASGPLISVTLGKTEYVNDPQSEEKFASYLTNATVLIARDRGRLK